MSCTASGLCNRNTLQILTYRRNICDEVVGASINFCQPHALHLRVADAETIVIDQSWGMTQELKEAESDVKATIWLLGVPR